MNVNNYFSILIANIIYYFNSELTILIIPCYQIVSVKTPSIFSLKMEEPRKHWWHESLPETCPNHISFKNSKPEVHWNEKSEW